MNFYLVPEILRRRYWQICFEKYKKISKIILWRCFSLHSSCSTRLSLFTAKLPRKKVKNFRRFCWPLGAGNWLRTITSDQIVYDKFRRFLFELVGMTSLDRNYWEIINEFVISFAWVILKTEKILQFWDKKKNVRSNFKRHANLHEISNDMIRKILRERLRERRKQKKRKIFHPSREAGSVRKFRNFEGRDVIERNNNEPTIVREFSLLWAWRN